MHGAVTGTEERVNADQSGGADPDRDAHPVLQHPERQTGVPAMSPETAVLTSS